MSINKALKVCSQVNAAGSQGCLVSVFLQAGCEDQPVKTLNILSNLWF